MHTGENSFRYYISPLLLIIGYNCHAAAQLHECLTRDFPPQSFLLWWGGGWIWWIPEPMDHSHSDVQAVEHTHKAHAAAKRIYRKGEKRICQSVLRDGDRKRQAATTRVGNFPSLNHRSQPAVLQYTTDREDWNFRKQINQNFLVFLLSSIYFC
jgi:hypothetical protein